MTLEFFCKKTVIYLIILVLIILIPGIIIQNNEKLLRLTYMDELFLRKEKFNEFKKNKEKINLVTGSSHAKDFIDVSYFGKDWFNYSNGAQYLKLSLVQLNEIVRNNIKIDTLIMPLDIFDLAPLPSEVSFNYFLYQSVFENKNIINPLLNFCKNPFDCFTGNIRLVKKITKSLFSNGTHFPDPRLIEMKANGMFPKKDTPFFDARTKIKYEKFNNGETFEELIKFVEQHNIHLIFVKTPKSASYFKAIDAANLNDWYAFVEKLKKKNKNVLFYDFEKMKMVDKYFIDLDHPNSELRAEFTTKFISAIRNPGI